MRVRLGERGRRSQTFLLKRRDGAEVVVNIAPVFDVPPRPFAQLGGGIGAGVDGDGDGSGFRSRFGSV
jgi:hypothetical protein